MATCSYVIGLVVGFSLLGIGIAIWPWSRKHDEIGLGGALWDKHRTRPDTGVQSYSTLSLAAVQAD